MIKCTKGSFPLRDAFSGQKKFKIFGNFFKSGKIKINIEYTLGKFAWPFTEIKEKNFTYFLLKIIIVFGS